MRNIEDHMRAEREAGNPCRLTVTLHKSGEFCARLSFASGMETASGTGATVADALSRLEDRLGYGI